MLSPKSNKSFPSHYTTYLEFSCSLEDNPLPDEHHPSGKGAADLTRMLICVYRSTAAEEWHMVIVHLAERAANMAGSRGSNALRNEVRTWKCRVEVIGSECGLSKYFPTKYQTVSGHKAHVGDQRLTKDMVQFSPNTKHLKQKQRCS